MVLFQHVTMLNRIILFSIKNKLIIGLFTVALIIWGGYSVTQLPIDAVPDITNNQVQILTVAPSQSAQDIERLVTFPIEQTMATIPGIEEVSDKVTVEITGTDMANVLIASDG